MKWTSIYFFSLFGVLMGTASLFGFTQNIELPLWIVIALITAVLIARSTTHKMFLHGVLAGLGIGVSNAVVQIAFFTMYMQNNPNAASELEHFSSTFTPQWFLFISSPIVGGIYGALIGALSVAAAKFHHPK
ncbi:MAG: hypothetical protein WCW35_15850 [Bacteroidota bacterium]